MSRMQVGDLIAITVQDPECRFKLGIGWRTTSAAVLWQGPLSLPAIYLGSVEVEDDLSDPYQVIPGHLRHYYFGDFRPNADEEIVCAWDIETDDGRPVAGQQEIEFGDLIAFCRVRLLSTA